MTIDDLPVPGEDLLDQILVELGLADLPQSPIYKATLSQHVGSFAIGSHLERSGPNLHESRDLAASAAEHLALARRDFEAMNPLAAVVTCLKFEQDGNGSWGEALRNLEAVERTLLHQGRQFITPAATHPHIELVATGSLRPNPRNARKPALAHSFCCTSARTAFNVDLDFEVNMERSGLLNHLAHGYRPHGSWSPECIASDSSMPPI